MALTMRSLDDGSVYDKHTFATAWATAGHTVAKLVHETEAEAKKKAEAARRAAEAERKKAEEAAASTLRTRLGYMTGEMGADAL